MVAVASGNCNGSVIRVAGRELMQAVAVSESTEAIGI